MAKTPGAFGGTASANGSFPEMAPTAPNLPTAAAGKKQRTNFPSPKVHQGTVPVMPHKVNGAS